MCQQHCRPDRLWIGDAGGKMALRWLDLVAHARHNTQDRMRKALAQSEIAFDRQRPIELARALCLIQFHGVDMVQGQRIEQAQRQGIGVQSALFQDIFQQKFGLTQTALPAVDARQVDQSKAAPLYVLHRQQRERLLGGGLLLRQRGVGDKIIAARRTDLALHYLHRRQARAFTRPLQQTLGLVGACAHHRPLAAQFRQPALQHQQRRTLRHQCRR